MGRILTWSVPVLAIQWEYGAHALMAHAWSVVPAIVLSSATLCVLDAWAIADGIWAISADHLLIPKTLTFGLPLEEGVFFVVTTCMCAGGITLVVVVDCFRRTRKVSWMEALCAIHQWGPATPPPPPRESHRAWIGHLHAALIVATIALVVHYESLVEPHAISLLVAGVLLIGVPHGALDGAFLPAAMIPLYVFGMLATCALWRLAPAIALLTFVATSVWHFGEGDVQPARHERATWRGVTEIVARGGMFLVAVYHHPAACLAVFRILIGVGHAAFALDFILDVFVPLHFIALWIAAALVALRFHESRRGWAAAIETVAVWTLFARVSPLVAFGVYFNGIHSVRHVLRVLDFSVVRRQQQQHQGAALNDTMPLVWAAVFYTIPVLIAAAAIVGGSSIFRGEVLLSFVTHNVLRVIFIGLSALTTPHVVLVARTFSS